MWRPQEKSTIRVKEDRGSHTPTYLLLWFLLLNAPWGHIRYLSLHCWLEQGDKTFACSQADFLHCKGKKERKRKVSSLFTLNPQQTLAAFTFLQQKSSPCGPCFLGDLPTQHMGLLASHSLVAGVEDVELPRRAISGCELWLHSYASN